jgi:hypothetical protein
LAIPLHVNHLPSPYQAPCVITIDAFGVHVGMSICHAGAVAPAFSCTLIKAFVPEEDEMIRDLHVGQGQETMSTTS